MDSPRPWKLICSALLAACLAAQSSQPVPRPDIPAEARVQIDRRTAERVREGELDHLVFYLLQSRRFTPQPPIEPALSAREFVESGKLPPAVGRRIGDLRRALDRPQTDERLSYFQALAGAADIAAEYARSMRSLFEKEFGAPAAASKDAHLAGWYQRRGHSTDTSPEANVAVTAGLEVLGSLDPAAALDRVLIVGPGLDLAPRTGFRDEPARSYQPQAVRETLVRLRLSASPQIHCVDINERVVRHLKQNLISAGKMNILTERYEPSPQYDLVVATNVLLYFDQPDVRLALSNIHYLMKEGGYFIHNDLRGEAEALSRELGMPPLQARTVRLTEAGLLDALVILRKAPRAITK